MHQRPRIWRQRLRVCFLCASALGANAASAQAPEEETTVRARDLTIVGEGGALPDDRLLHEGAFIVERRAALRTLDSGGWALVFHEEADARPLPPMGVQPSMALMAMKRLDESAGGGAEFVVSGQVFVYQGRNYLLPTRYQLLDSEPQAEAPPSQETQPPASDASAPAKDPSVADLIRGIERATGRNARSQTPPSAAAAEEGAPALRREGELVVSRLGRILRTPGAGWAFAFDSDVDSATPAEAPMVLAPSLNTMILEATGQSFPQMPLTLSGRVLIYEGRNYIIPTMLVLQRRDAGDIATAR